MLQSRASKPSITTVDTPLTSIAPVVGPSHMITCTSATVLVTDAPLTLLPRMTMLLAGVLMSVMASATAKKNT
jgi:hypothetical protein